jgi:hypothetical protein
VSDPADKLQERLAALPFLEAISDCPIDLGEYIEYALTDLRAFHELWKQQERDGNEHAPYAVQWIFSGIMHLESIQHRYERERRIIQRLERP